MRQRGLAVVLVCLLLAGSAQAFVFYDSVSDLKRTIEFIWQQTTEIRKMAELLRQTMKLVEQVKGTAQMIEYALDNLQNMPKDGNILDWFSSMDSQVSNILGTVQYLGFSLDAVTRNFETLYGNVSAITTPAGRAERYAAMRAARLEMTGIAMQTQSIKETFTGIYTRLALLLGISSLASGQKALAQLQMQQQAMIQQQQQLAVSIQATAARLVAMEHAEKIVREMMDEAAAKHHADVWYGDTRQRLLPPGFTGFVMQPGGGR